MTAPRVALAPSVNVKPISQARTGGGRRLKPANQILLQLACIAIAATVLFPIVWIVGMSLDPRNISRPDSLIPPGANLDAYARVIARPTLHPVSFIQLALNSLTLAVLISALSVGLGVMAAYAFSRMKFRGRQFMMLLILAVLMLPAVATVGSLYINLNRISFGDFRLGGSLLGVALAVTSTQLPFAIWNMKGYLDTIPNELEEAAVLDGAPKFQTFVRGILPLATPVLAVTALFGFIAGWTEFLLAQVFVVQDPSQWTLAVALNALVGQYSGSTPWSTFAAFAILFALPVMIVYLLLQPWIVSGLTVGGVKG